MVLRKQKHVFITGVGVICSIGNNYRDFIDALKKGLSGAAKITAFDPEGLRSVYGCEVKDYEPLDHFAKNELKRMDRASQLCLTSVREAVESAGLDHDSLNKERCGVSFGSTLGGMISGGKYYRKFKKNKVYASLLVDYFLYCAGSRVCIDYSFFGPNIAISTACTSSNVAMGYAYDLIQTGTVDLMVAGGFDTMAEVTCSGFGSLRNVTTDVCRPFDKNRNGLILGEGAACLILESAEHCEKRGGKPIGMFLGYGMSSDAYHMTAPDVTGRGQAKCMELALNRSGITTDDVDYINAHGTGTRQNDSIETSAIKKVFKERAYEIPVSSTKSMYGHTLGAAGAIEAVTSIAALQDDFIPPTINYSTPDPKCDLDYVPNNMRKKASKVVLSNNFAFGGNNCSIVLGKEYGTIRN